jgi:NAD(P)-dependent dehydrogenase (short-subunit alcohol dehydrogenase family)
VTDLAAPLIDLRGAHVVVTGGGTGIGAAVALGAAAAGADVLVVGRRTEPLEEVVAQSKGSAGRISALSGDVAVRATARAVVDHCADLWPGDPNGPRVDGLVNAAGVARIGPAEDLTDDEFAEVLEINLMGSFRMSREVGRLMLDAGRGSIVNIGSLTSIGGFPGRAAYAVSKHGVIGLTKALASEWGASGVRVNAVSPGFVRTPMTDSAGRRGLLDFDAIARRTPLRRRASTTEMVGPILFLLSDAASFVSGTELVADGGWTSYVGPENPFADARRRPDGGSTAAGVAADA